LSRRCSDHAKNVILSQEDELMLGILVSRQGFSTTAVRYYTRGVSLKGLVMVWWFVCLFGLFAWFVCLVCLFGLFVWFVCLFVWFVCLVCLFGLFVWFVCLVCLFACLFAFLLLIEIVL
jgi:hypothetical protein